MSKIIYISPPLKKTNVAQAKLLWIILDAIGWPITILGIFANLDNIKSLLISIVALAFLITRWYFYVVQKKQSIREKEIDLRMKQLEEKEKQLEFDRRQARVNGR